MTCYAFARAGLLGNPSDGMEGACIALAIRNFYAEVQLRPRAEGSEVQIEANPEHDPATFADLESLHMHMQRWGYYGGRRLLLVRPHAAPECMFVFCRLHNIASLSTHVQERPSPSDSTVRKVCGCRAVLAQLSDKRASSQQCWAEPCPAHCTTFRARAPCQHASHATRAARPHRAQAHTLPSLSAQRPCAAAQATCSAFFAECRSRGVELPHQGFALSYHTTIPKHAGLAGSSAIVTAALSCLLQWAGISAEQWPVRERPTFVLHVEQEELRIAAGLMDRVAQVRCHRTGACSRAASRTAHRMLPRALCCRPGRACDPCRPRAPLPKWHSRHGRLLCGAFGIAWCAPAASGPRTTGHCSVGCCQRRPPCPRNGRHAGSSLRHPMRGEAWPPAPRIVELRVQTYGGTVYMSFRKKDMRNGAGRYEYLPTDKLPPLWLMYCDAARADSNTVHLPVKQRWLDGDDKVVQCAQDLAELADTGRCEGPASVA